MTTWRQRRARARFLRGAIADTSHQLEAGPPPPDPRTERAVERSTRTTLMALESELEALGGGRPPLGARPTKRWSPREAWLDEALHETALHLPATAGVERAAIQAVLHALEREERARGW